MLKVRSRSLVITEPALPQLKQHMEHLIQKEQEHIKQKLERQFEKEQRIDTLEKEFVQWADRKENKIRQKLQKSSKNKQAHLHKIVKKCQDHDKYLNQKYKNYQTKKKATLRDAWKKAEKFNHSIQDYHSKHHSKQPRIHHQNSEEHLTASRFIQQKQIPIDNQLQQYIPTNLTNQPSKYYSNASKDYWGQLNQSIKQLKSIQIPYRGQEDKQQVGRPMTHDKLKQTIARFKKHIDCTQQQKIQQLGQRLTKIQKTRIKKIQRFKKKKQDKDRTTQTSHLEKRQKKGKNDRTQRIHSESMMREKRVHDWSEHNKLKRDQFQQTHLQYGNHLLQNQKIKYLKTSLAKKIANSAIQKKLYFERLHH